MLSLSVARDKLGVTILLMALLALFFVAPEGQAVITVAMWCVVIWFCAKRPKERLLLLLFQVTLFTFLMTRLILPDFFHTSYMADDVDGTIRMFDAETLRFIYTTLALSIFGSYLGFAIIPEQQGDKIQLYDTSTAYVDGVRHISKMLSYVCALFFAVTIVEKSIFVFNNGYFELYADFESRLPSIIHKLSSLYTPLFMLYLATFPTKQEARGALWLYFLIALLSLTTGSRTAFMLTLVFLLFYFCLRNVVNPEEPWLSRKAVIAIICVIPLLLAGMFMIDFIRAEREMEDAGIADMFINFFYQQGTSAQVIGLTYEMRDVLDDGRIFSFGQIIDNFNKNIIFKIMGTAVEYRPQTEEMALYGHSLANTLSNLHMHKSFLTGVGLGSSYIAEVWHDFGFIGLMLWNMMYGIIFARFFTWAQKGLWSCAFGLLMIPEIIYSPRGHATAFLYVFFSITILLVFYMIHVLAKRYMKQ